MHIAWKTLSLAALASLATACGDGGGAGKGTDTTDTTTTTDDTDSTTTGSETAPVDTATGEQLAGFTTFVLYAYDPATDSAVGYTSSAGDASNPTFGFIFFNEDYQSTGDYQNDGCLYFLESADPLPRAEWAGAGSDFLFGAEFDPASSTISSNCDEFFGDGFSQEIFDQLVSTGVWGAGAKVELNSELATQLTGGGIDLDEVLGGDHYSTVANLPQTNWDSFVFAFELDEDGVQVASGGNLVNVLAADAIVDVEPDADTTDTVVPPAPTAQTLAYASYDFETITLWIFQ